MIFLRADLSREKKKLSCLAGGGGVGSSWHRV